MAETYFFDTYALLEIVDGNPAYLKYAPANQVINEFVYAELCYKLLRTAHPLASTVLSQCSTLVRQSPPRVVKKAMHFRVKNKRQKLSIPDCVGYTLARELGILFLTGDKEFKNLPGVEFVKA